MVQVEFTERFVPGLVPKSTEVTPQRFVPTSVTVSPAEGEPLVGEMAMSFGPALGVGFDGFDGDGGAM